MWSESDGERESQEVQKMGRSSNSSELAMTDSRIIAAATRDLPTIANLNVSTFSRMHLGPKFITQNVHSTQVLKGRILGLELVSAKNSRRLRCSVAVFVCWAFVVVSGLALYLFYFVFSKQPTIIDLGIKEEWYLRRANWQAMPWYGLTFLQLPVSYVLIGHTAGKACEKKYECIERVLEIQRDHLQRGWNDIGPNFLVGGNGFVFEGRGANVFGAMVKSWNRKSISIMFLGDYRKDVPFQSQFDHLNILLEELVKKHVLTSDYVLYGHCQVSKFIITPGPEIMNRLDNFSHWNPVNKTFCLSQ